MSTDDPRDLIGAFVLGACSVEEHAQVRAHMKVDASFRAEVESFDVVHDALLEVPTTLDDVTPGVDLKRSVMEQVQAEASLFAAASTGERAAIVSRQEVPAPSAPRASTEAPRGTGAPAPSPRRNAFMAALTSPARATALAAVIVALIVGGIALGGGGGSDVREVNGQVTPVAGANATVRMVVDKDQSRLKLSGFEKAGTGRKYQVWLKSGDAAPKPTTVLFDVDARGNGTATVPGDMKGVDDVLVTSEPESGSQTPTTDPVLHVQI
ncbi:anti-sigma factor [Patulibacter sp.]|uniref:anti-sigma factor n=1 Tax=Patulibacter sp. TaxID=1912859 RepID=UPI00271C769C|nr:anti-sigma factor [Patulibacter sp.]MDO9408394.1 anti-sigma factor [Patulibacter sp.]